MTFKFITTIWRLFGAQDFSIMKISETFKTLREKTICDKNKN